MGDWEKESKLGLFSRHCFKAQGWGYKFFHQPFGKVPMVWFIYFYLSLFIVLWGDGFLPQVLRYIYISFQSEETSEDLIICIPILLQWKKFSLWFFLTPFEGFFHVIFYVPFWLNVFGLLLFLLWRNILTLTGEYSKSLLLASQQIVYKRNWGKVIEFLRNVVSLKFKSFCFIKECEEENGFFFFF